MAPIQILLASDAPEDEIWIQRSLTLAYPEIQLVRTADPNQFLATLRTGVFHLIIVRADLVWFDRAKTLQAVQEVPLRPQVVYLTEPDDAVPELMRSPHETEVYVMRTSEPTHALAPVVHQVLRRITEPALKRPDGPFDFLPVGWFRMDEQGHLLEANSGLVSMLSYGAEKDLQSLSLADLFFSPQEFLRLQAEMSGLEGLDAFETQFACRGGSRLWVQLSLRRLTNGEETLTGWEGTVENISAQKNLAQSLREAEQFFQTILSSIQEGVVFYDRDFRYQIWNPYMEKLTGLRAELMLGSFAGANLAWGEPNLMNILNRAMRGETISRKNVAYQIWQTGKKGNYEAVYAPHVNIEGTVIGVIAFILEGAPKTREKEEHQRALLMEQKQRQLAEGLGRIILAMSALPSLPTLLELICGEAAAFLEMDSAQIWLLEGNALIGAAASGLRETSISDLYVSLSETDHLVVQVFETKRPIFLYDLLEDSHMIHSGLSGIFQVRSMVGVPLLIAGQAVGVLLLIDTRRPHYFNADELETILYLGSQAAMAVENARLFSSLQEAQQKIVQAYDATLTGWAKALELRDRDTEGHTQRVVEMTLKLAQAFGMSGEELVHVYRGALLHDIGKMGIPDNILRKPGTLDEGEWKIMRDHPSFAYEMLKPIDYLDHALDIPYCHHEKWNGTGYPRGLKGEEIPLAARIFAVVDVWDALSFDRPYRKALPPDLIFDYIRAESGKHFDPQVVEKFLETFGPPRTPDILQGISIPA